MPPDTRNAQLHFDLGFAYAEMGLVDDAASELEAALAIDGGRARANEGRRVLATIRSPWEFDVFPATVARADHATSSD